MFPDLNAIVLERIDVSPALGILRIAPEGWELPHFEAGQFAVLGLPYGARRCDLATPEEESASETDKLIKRAYSIASSSVAKEYLEFYIALVPSGALTPRLFALQPGHRVWLGKKISGMFTLDQVAADKQLVLIGTGTGLAPYMSMLRTHLKHRTRRVAVIHGARHSWELGYRSELAMLAHQHSTLTYLPAISRPAEEIIRWTGEIGHIQDIWNRKPLVARWGSQPSPADSHVFLCGNPGMIDRMLTILSAEGFVEQTKKVSGQIHLERYW